MIFTDHVPCNSIRFISMSLKLTKIFIVVLLICSVNLQGHAQKSAFYNNNTHTYRLGMELLEKEKYGAAQKAFESTAQAIEEENSDLKVNAEYYAALCALELFNKDAEFMFKRFIQDHSENPKVRTAYFQLGKYKFRKRSYKRAIEWFNKVDIYDLNNKELSEYYFKLGYSYFVKGDNEKARKLFYEIKDTDTKYSYPAIYYYSHISYTNQNYETALQGFEKLRKNGSFQHIVPYYISQIYYMQKKHEKLIEFATPLLDSANTQRAPEISRLIGEAYYAIDRYAEAVPFLKRYMDEGHHQSREDLYQLAYAHYKSGSYDQAAQLFKQVVNTNDNLAQNAFYHLADCYVNQQKKKYARYAFRSASKFDYDKNIQEDAAFSYAKLSYDLNLNPIFAINRYINKYPDSKRVDEAYSYLVKVYFTTKNYKKALRSLDKIKNKNEELNLAYQKIAYYRGVELFNDQKLLESTKIFDKSLVLKLDGDIEALCNYWKGEAFYRLNQYGNAIKSYNDFIYAPSSFSIPLFNQVYYNMGYAYFKQKDYSESNTSFRKFVRHITPDFQIRHFKNDSIKEVFSRTSDAYLRLGDGYFVIKDYPISIEYYDLAINLLTDSLDKLGYHLTDIDYALFQKALSLGVLGKAEEKINVILGLLEKYPSSMYTDDAKFEMAQSYTVLNQPDSAISWYKKIAEDHPASSYISRSLLNMGLEYYNKNEGEVALVTFKRVIKDYPATKEALEALVGLKNIYIDIGDIDSYASYVEGLSFANITQASLDSTSYEAAELHYMRGNCESAVNNFKKYIEKFPVGYFMLNANYYLSECLSKEKDTNSMALALAGYAYVINSPKNSFTEKALLKAAALNFGFKNYQEAIDLYRQLELIAEYKIHIIESRIGQMRAHFILEDYENAIVASRAVITTEKIAAEIISEAHYIIARSALESDNYNLAIKEFNITQGLTRSEKGASSQYYVAYIQYLRSEHDSSEQTIFKLAQRTPSYDYWVAKGFILLADNYLQMDNGFQAKATLQSIIDNSDKQELIAIAQEKLDKIKEIEALNKKREIETIEMEIEFENYDIKYDELFEEEEEEDELIGDKKVKGEELIEEQPDKKEDENE
ncbi:MAG TPA: tetratricopeptide repeat protein [Flavobacteriales bacterium]|nr:tetratricopeptide repeat protein [Flavobacteriales bacterium]